MNNLRKVRTLLFRVLFFGLLLGGSAFAADHCCPTSYDKELYDNLKNVLKSSAEEGKLVLLGVTPSDGGKKPEDFFEGAPEIWQELIDLFSYFQVSGDCQCESLQWILGVCDIEPDELPALVVILPDGSPHGLPLVYMTVEELSGLAVEDLHLLLDELAYFSGQGVS